MVAVNNNVKKREWAFLRRPCKLEVRTGVASCFQLSDLAGVRPKSQDNDICSSPQSVASCSQNTVLPELDQSQRKML